MRRLPFGRLMLTLVSFSGVAVWVACGESDSQDVLIPDSGTDVVLKRDTGSVEEPDTGGGDNDSGGQPKDSSAPEVKVYDAGQVAYLDGSAFGVDGGIKCVVGGELEHEPNDTKFEIRAQSVTGWHTLRRTRCGVAEVKNDAGKDDWLEFQLSPDASSFYVQYEGNVHVFLETDGQAPVDITTEPPPSVGFVKGSPYYVQVRTKDGKEQTWRVTLFQE